MSRVVALDAVICSTAAHREDPLWLVFHCHDIVTQTRASAAVVENDDDDDNDNVAGSFIIR